MTPLVGGQHALTGRTPDKLSSTMFVEQSRNACKHAAVSSALFSQTLRVFFIYLGIQVKVFVVLVPAPVFRRTTMYDKTQTCIGLCKPRNTRYLSLEL